LKILVIDLLNMGDLLFTTPALRVLRSAYPEASIDMLATTQFRDTLLLNPHLNEVIGFDKSGYHRSARHFLALVAQLRSSRYDLLISFHASAKTALIAALCGARQKWGLVSGTFEKVFDRPVRQRTDIHRVDSYLQVLYDLGIPESGHQGMEMWIGTAADQRVSELWQEEGLTAAPAVGLMPGASVPMKRWPTQRFAELADRLGDNGMRPVIFGGAGETEMASEIASKTQCTVADFTSRLSVMELAAAARRCSVFVSGDTGPLHVAVSQKVPVVALFGPTRPEEFGPYQVPSVVCKAEGTCLACEAGAVDQHTCLAAIEAETVFEGVRKLTVRG
jgi:heptosyltransferase II